LAPLRDLVRRRGQGRATPAFARNRRVRGPHLSLRQAALVPRPETEELVGLLKSRIENRESKILDVGTGSGVIALSLAAAFPEAEITATDISEEALALARENANRLNLTSRIIFLKSELLMDVTDGYDVIVANLPYIATGDRGSLSREVLHDPEAALFGGERGDEIMRRLIEAAPSHLAPGGLLALELGLGQADDLAALLAKKNYHDIKAERDYAGVIRFLFGRYG
jgi:protein-(glutamine-N5) methyltransferase, release factor-specific